MKQNRTRPRAVHRKNKNPNTDEVPCLYPGETAVLLATGPSLSEEQIEYIRPFHEKGLIRVFGLNDSYGICDFLDVFYACDPKWWDVHVPNGLMDHPCEHKWTQDKQYPSKFKGQVHCVSGGGGTGLSKVPHHIHYGSNSGFQLINLAWHFGIRKFILLGYNMDVPKGTQQHYFGPHPKPLNGSNNYRGFIAQYNNIDKADRQLITNCTQPTALACFRKMELKDALPLTLLEDSHHGSRTHETPIREADPAPIPEPEGDNNRHRPVIDPSRC